MHPGTSFLTSETSPMMQKVAKSKAACQGKFVKTWPRLSRLQSATTSGLRNWISIDVSQPVLPRPLSFLPVSRRLQMSESCSWNVDFRNKSICGVETRHACLSPAEGTLPVPFQTLQSLLHAWPSYNNLALPVGPVHARDFRQSQACWQGSSVGVVESAAAAAIHSTFHWFSALGQSGLCTSESFLCMRANSEGVYRCTVSILALTLLCTAHETARRSIIQCRMDTIMFKRPKNSLRSTSLVVSRFTS